VRNSDLLIAISSCEYFEANKINDAQRDTWLPEANKLRVDYKFFHGQGATTKGDVIVLDVPDDYSHMSHKTKESLRWAFDMGYNFVFRCFPDTYVCVERLMTCQWDKADYWGDFRPGFFCCGGHGYCLSRKAMEYLINAPIKSDRGPEHPNWNAANAGAEDIWVGLILSEHPDIVRADAREVLEFAGQIMPGPEKRNTKVTSHLSDVVNVRPRPHNYDPIKMHEVHARWLNS